MDKEQDTSVKPLFLALLRYSLGIEETFPFTPTPEQWQQLYVESHRQSLVGMLFDGVNRLRGEQRPPMEMTMQWANEAEIIRGMNGRLNTECGRLTQLFEAEGHKTVILKGQANARLYPNPLNRMTGDIDILVSGGTEKVLEMLDRLHLTGEDEEVSYHHVHLKEKVNGTEVEVHFRPVAFHYNEKLNQRMHDFLYDELKKGCEKTEYGFRVPSMKFALVMQLSHIHRHLVGEGLGMRQVIDYWILLRNSTEEDRKVVASVLKKLKLNNMARAMMWVISRLFDEKECLLPVKHNERKGRWVLDKMFRSGNFGKYSKEYPGLWETVNHFGTLYLERLWFDPSLFWPHTKEESKFWGYLLRSIPKRISKGTLLLRNTPNNNKK